MITFSAVPVGDAPPFEGEKPLRHDLESLANVLRNRGCEILMVGRFAVSARAPLEIFDKIKTEKGTGDLRYLDKVYEPTPPIFFSESKDAD